MYFLDVIDKVNTIYFPYNITFTVVGIEEYNYKHNTLREYLDDLTSKKYNTSMNTSINLLFVNQPSNDTVRGLAFLNTICTKYSNLVINANVVNKEMMPKIVAHEIGHILGASHTEDNSLMNSIIGGDTPSIFDKNSINMFDSKRNSSCVKDNLGRSIGIGTSTSTSTSTSTINDISLIILFIIRFATK